MIEPLGDTQSKTKLLVFKGLTFWRGKVSDGQEPGRAYMVLGRDVRCLKWYHGAPSGEPKK